MWKGESIYEGEIKVFRRITKRRVLGTHRNQKTLDRNIGWVMVWKGWRREERKYAIASKGNMCHSDAVAHILSNIIGVSRFEPVKNKKY